VLGLLCEVVEVETRCDVIRAAAV